MDFVALFNIFDNLERIYHNAFDAEQNRYEKVFLNFHLCQNMLDSIYIYIYSIKDSTWINGSFTLCIGIIASISRKYGARINILQKQWITAVR